MITITSSLHITDNEISFTFFASPGPGGQNVNKVASGVLLRFNLEASSLPQDVKERLFISLGDRITKQGEILIKASQFRTQERNKHAAIKRLVQIIKAVAVPPKKRKRTRPTFSSVQNRLDRKKLHGRKKADRKVNDF